MKSSNKKSILAALQNEFIPKSYIGDSKLRSNQNLKGDLKLPTAVIQAIIKKILANFNIKVAQNRIKYISTQLHTVQDVMDFVKALQKYGMDQSFIKAKKDVVIISKKPPSRKPARKPSLKIKTGEKTRNRNKKDESAKSEPPKLKPTEDRPVPSDDEISRGMVFYPDKMDHPDDSEEIRWRGSGDRVGELGSRMRENDSGSHEPEEEQPREKKRGPKIHPVEESEEELRQKEHETLNQDLEEGILIKDEVVTKKRLEDLPDPKSESRRVQVIIRHNYNRRKTFVKGQTHELECWIGDDDPEDNRARGTSNKTIPKTQLPEGGISLEVQMLYQDEQIANQSIHLPQKDRSTSAFFNLELLNDDDFPTLELAFLYHGRIFEAVTINASIVKSAGEELENAKIQVRSRIKRREVINLERTSEVDLAITMREEETIIFGYQKGQTKPLRAVNKAIQYLNTELFETESSLLRARIRGDQEAPRLDIKSPEVLDIFRKLARHGHELHRQIGFIGRDAKLIQVTNTSSDYIQPIEFVYDRGFPADNAKMCAGWEKALESDLDHCPICKHSSELTEDELSEATVICPLGFWSLRLIIERHQEETVKDDQSSLETPATGKTTLRYPKNILYGFSNNVKPDDHQKTSDFFKQIFQAQAFEAPDWPEWKKKIKSDSPSLLVALPHQASTGGHNFLEIGGNIIRGGALNSIYVTREKDQPGPIVILLGCRTNKSTDLGYASMARRFQENKASIVVGTLSKVHGQNAAPIARELVRQLVNVSSADERFGALLRRIRRRMLLKGYLIALSVIALGDADWKLETRLN